MNKESSPQGGQEEQREIVEGIKAFEREQMRAWLKTELHKEQAKPNWRKPLAIAASIAILLSFGWLTYNQQTYWTRLEAKYETQMPEVVLMGSTGQVAENKAILRKAKKAQTEKRWNDALEMYQYIEPYPELYDDYFQARYQMMLIYLHQQEVEKAKAIGKELLERPEKHYLKEKINALLKDLKQPKFLFFG